MNKRQKRGCVLVLVGLCMVFCAMGMHFVQENQDALAGENSEILLQQLQLNRTYQEEVTLEETAAQEEVPVTDMPVKKYLDYSMIGTLRIPSLGMMLPILSDWSYPLLEIAPCRYTGSIPEENMILMGHNYKSHFTPLHQITLDTAVEFEDVNGVVYHYTVAEITYLHKNDGESLPSEYPLTLFTCTAGGQNRVVIRCSQVK